MTRGELADILGLQDSYLEKHWTRIVEVQKKRNIELVKIGRGDQAKYGIRFPWDYDIVFDADAIDVIF